MDTPNSPHDPSQPSREAMMGGLFANLVAQQTNMALMFLGQVPHPESGERVRDLQAAKMFIDTLEMIEVKTRGNLDKSEETMLKRSLTALRMGFVEVSNQTSATEAKEPLKTPEPTPASPDASASAGGRPSSDSAPPISAEADSRKKFSKKY